MHRLAGVKPSDVEDLLEHNIDHVDHSPVGRQARQSSNERRVQTQSGVPPGETRRVARNDQARLSERIEDFFAVPS